MTQPSEERLPESVSADANPPTARILQLKTRQSDLQRAIQQRAQESVERERELDQEERRPKPLKWLVIASIAVIPVLLTFTAVDGFLRALHRYIDVAATSMQNQQSESSEAADPNATLQSSEPGVVLLQPIIVPESTPAPQPAPSPEQQFTR
jgi:hypothetical protein